MLILYSAGLLLSTGIVLGSLIAVFTALFGSQEDPRVLKVSDALPAYNCGACGHPGCVQYAMAVALKAESRDKCRPGGKKVSDEIGMIMKTGPHQTAAIDQ